MLRPILATTHASLPAAGGNEPASSHATNTRGDM